MAPKESGRMASRESNMNSNSGESQAEHHKHSGTKQLLGTQTLVGNMTSVKIGGRKTSLALPPDVTKSVVSACEKPTEAAKLLAAPSEDLLLEYAYGFNGTCRDNLHAIGPSSCLYNIGSLGVVFDFDKNQQSFFSAHSAGVTAIAFCRKTRLVATGQCAGQEQPRISLWSVDDPMEERHRLSGFQHSVYSLAFSANGDWLFSVAAEEGVQQKGSLQRRQSISSTEDGKTSSQATHERATPKRRPSSAQASNINRGKSEPIFVWSVPGTALKSRSGSGSGSGSFSGSGAGDPFTEMRAPKLRLDKMIGNRFRMVPHPTDAGKLFAFSGRYGTILRSAGHDWASEQAVELQVVEGLTQTIHCAAFVVGDQDLIACGGTGEVYVIVGTRCVRTIPINPGMRVQFALVMGNGEVACGGESSGISFLKADLSGLARPRGVVCDLEGLPMDMTTAECFTLESGLDELLVGTRQGGIVRVQFDKDYRILSAFTAQQSPSGECEVTALCTSPKDANRVAIADREGSVRFFDARRCQMLQVKPYKCLTTVTSITFHPEGQLLVAGLSNGNIEGVLCMAWMGMVKKTPPRCEFITKIPEDTPISTVRVSPGEGRYLAAGSSISGTVHILRLMKEEMYDSARGGEYFSFRPQMLRTLTGNATAVIFLQFSKNQAEITSNARDGQVLSWEIETGKRLTPSMQPENYLGEGAQFLLTMAWPMIGIWNEPRYDSTTDLVAEASNNCKFAAVGDSDGRVKLHRFPVFLEDAKAKVHYGHSSKVAEVAWTKADRVISAGAKVGDGLLQWRLSTADPLERYEKFNRKENPHSGSHLNMHDDKAPESPNKNKRKGDELQDFGDDELLAEIKRRWGDKGPPGFEKERPRASPQLVDQATNTDALDPPPSPPTLVGNKDTPQDSSGDTWLIQKLSRSSNLLVNETTNIMTQKLSEGPLPHENVKMKERLPPFGGWRHGDRGPAAASDESKSNQENVANSSSLGSGIQSNPASNAYSLYTSREHVGAQWTRGGFLRTGSVETINRVRSRSRPHVIRAGSPVISPVILSYPTPQLVRAGSPIKSRTTTPRPTSPTVISSVPHRAIVKWPPRVLSREVSPVKVVPSQRSVPTQSSKSSVQTTSEREYSVFIRSASGSELAEAAAYLYHPPFQLNQAISYKKTDERALESFDLPSGWGVLRSHCGLLLWLRIQGLTKLGEAFWAQETSRLENLSMEFWSWPCATDAADPLTITLTAPSSVSGSVELNGDEGLLHPYPASGSTQVKYILASDFAETVKCWLSGDVVLCSNRT